jgi:hypothetical protein
MRKVLLVALSGVAVVGIAGCVGSTEPATKVTSASAQLNARGYTDDGPATWWWEYDTVQSDLGTENDTQVCGDPPERDARCGPASGGSQSNQVPLNVTVRALDPGTTYYFRACGQDENDSAPTCAQTRSFTTLPGTSFNYTGTAQTWTVPAGVTSVTLHVYGAQGGGLGGGARATFGVSPGQVLQLNVGGRADGSTGGFNGGGNGGVPTSGGAGSGGGGASDVRVSPFGLADRIIVAGGGGGDAGSGLFQGGTGGAGGGVQGAGGGPNPTNNSGSPGRGGTATGGGAGGAGDSGGTDGTGGTLGRGGQGGAGTCRSPGCGGGGGGGGGRYGGGGGGGSYSGGGGGGGGSGHGPAGAALETGVNLGNGKIVISY